MNFDEALYDQLQALPKWSLRHRHLVNVLELPPDNPRRQRIVATLQQKAEEMTTERDWTSTAIPWDSIIQFFITNLWPLLLQLLGGL